MVIIAYDVYWGSTYNLFEYSMGILLKRYTRFIWMCKFISVYTTGFGGVLFCLGSTVYGWYTLFIQVVVVVHSTMVCALWVYKFYLGIVLRLLKLSPVLKIVLSRSRSLSCNYPVYLQLSDCLRPRLWQFRGQRRASIISV